MMKMMLVMTTMLVVSAVDDGAGSAVMLVVSAVDDGAGSAVMVVVSAVDDGAGSAVMVVRGMTGVVQGYMATSSIPTV